jgi:hypothetical protein
MLRLPGRLLPGRLLLEVWCGIRPSSGAVQTKPGSAVVRGA